MVHFLLQSSGCSPLSIACKLGAVNSAEILLAYGANPNGCRNVSTCTIHVHVHACRVHAQCKLYMYMYIVSTQCYIVVETLFQGRHRPMVEASAQGHVGMVRSLLAYKANVNVSDEVRLLLYTK